MTLHRMSIDDYEEVVDMYYNFTYEIFSKVRSISPKYFYYKAVQGWINDNKHIIVVKSKGEIIGFSLAYIDDFNGLTESFYNGEIAYVKPNYRKTRAAYMLYRNVVEMSKELGLNLNSNGRIENGVDKMIEKHFNPMPLFINYEKGKQ